MVGHRGVNFGVWVHAVLLVYLIFAFVKAAPREPFASFGFRVPDVARVPG